MDEKGIRSPAVRRIITIVLLLGISGTFMAFYYIAYIPQQQADFNQRMFRILHEIADNFAIRAENYGTVSFNSFINKESAHQPVSIANLSDKDFNNIFKKSFSGINSKQNSFYTEPHFQHDSIVYETKDFAKRVVHSSEKTLSDILEPLISIHPNIFESVFLVKLASDTAKKNSGGGRYDTILYRSSGLDIANIKTDSLFPNRNLQAPALSEMDIEGIKYKLFLMPFKMNIAAGETFILTGIISTHDYSNQSQNIPIDFLLTVVFILVFLLLCLPFLKIFVLSVQENILIADVRLIIASIFIIPFVITLLFSSVWLYFYPDHFTNKILSSLQNEIKTNFYKEVQECINQAKDYDSVIIDPSRKLIKTHAHTDIESIDQIKDSVFYPESYRNLENVHWMDRVGDDIATWRFTKDSATYFNVKDRQYFREILYHKGYLHPTSKDTFTIEATISRLTGEYTLNTVIPSNVQISPGKKSIATGIAGRMYSVYNTVVPPGFNYCLIDENGEIIFHSDTARNLQENLLDETSNSQFLKNAISHQDSAYTDNIQLNNEPVKMMIKPLGTLPYYLVTYYDKRAEYLFIFHIVAFVFLCMSILLLFASLFSYCIMTTNKRISKLLFTPGILNWLKPFSNKKDSYIRNCLQLLALIILVFLFSTFLSPEQNQLYMLNYAVLLPLFAVTGYYIVRKANKVIDNDKDENQQKVIDNGKDENQQKVIDNGKDENQQKILLISKKKINLFSSEVLKILLLYAVSILIYRILQDVLFFNKPCPDAYVVKLSIWLLIVLLPVVMCIIARINIDYLRKAISRIKGLKNFKMHYLTHYIISLLLLVLVISVIPTITLTRYALNEERLLHFQTFQMGLAKKTQERRTGINAKLWQTKLDVTKTTEAFVDSLKFNPGKGLYLGGLSLDTGRNFTDSITSNAGKKLPAGKLPPDTTCSSEDPFLIACSPFYKTLSQFLFLPPDHDEFYDNINDRNFYYWREAHNKKAGNSLHLYYNNLTDHKNAAFIIVGGKLSDFNPFTDDSHRPLTLLMLLAIIIFVFLFYKVIKSVARRIFMIGYFDGNKTTASKSPQNKIPDSDWLIQRYNYIERNELNKISCFTGVHISFAAIRKIENQLVKEEDDECILKIHLALIPAYERIWEDCTDIEKFTLYDFALDGFTNYKKVITLFQLYQKGLLIKENGNFHLMTLSFRNFLLTKGTTETIKALSRQSKGSWSTLRTVFYIILLVVTVFIFLSQEEASKRLITIVTSLGALLPAILKLFDKSTFSTGASKSSP